MIKRFQSELTMDTSDLPFPLIKKSNLNFSINESSFPLLISIKKPFSKIKNGSQKDGRIVERVKRRFTSELYCLSEVQKGWLDKQGSFELHSTFIFTVYYLFFFIHETVLNWV